MHLWFIVNTYHKPSPHDGLKALNPYSPVKDRYQGSPRGGENLRKSMLPQKRSLSPHSTRHAGTIHM